MEGDESREAKGAKDLVGFTHPNNKYIGCSDCSGKSLDGFKQGIYII